MKHYTDQWLTIYEGDCREVMADLPESSVHTVITSPPYFGLRDYGHDEQIGVEPTVDAYIEHLIQVGHSVRHVLRDDGIFWLNLGDSYSSGYRKNAPAQAKGVKVKELLGVPWRVAFALQADGWYLRRDIIWSKPNPMPESADDRPTTSHEYIFMLTKKPTYFYDGFAVKEPISEAMAAAIRRQSDDEHQRVGQRTGRRANPDSDSLTGLTLGRNRRSVWSIPTVSYPGAHYAVFPPKLVEPMILASTSEKGVCAECGRQSVRITEGRRLEHHTTTANGKTMDGPYAGQAAIRSGVYIDTETVGWEVRCDHQAPLVPATVLDPFAGSGTTGMVANRLSRAAILIDINAEYLKQQMERNAAIPMGL